MGVALNYLAMTLITIPVLAQLGTGTSTKSRLLRALDVKPTLPLVG